MEVFDDQLEAGALKQLAAAAVSLLCARDFTALTERFPYMLAYDRDPAAAVAMDLARCFAEAPSVEAVLQPENAHYKVGYFTPNDITLHTLIECRFTSPSGDELLVELVVIGKDRLMLALE